MKLCNAIEEITGQLRKKVSYTDIANALCVTRQYANQIKNKELSHEQLMQLDNYFKTTLATVNLPVIIGDNDCIQIPVRGDVTASMGYGVTVYNEQQTASYAISKKLAQDLGVNNSSTEMIFAYGDSMLPTIEGGDSLLIDLTRRTIYDGKIYCVRIEGQLYAKRLQKIPPDTIRIVSDNEKYRCFEIDMSKNPGYDFAVIGEVRWWGRVAR